MIRYDDIMARVDAVQKGDMLDVSSDVLQMMRNCRRQGIAFDANRLIDSVQAKVGPEGTVLIRTWNWDFCHGAPFNIKETPSQVGALGNVALQRGDFRRTRHPLYSFMVWGKHQAEFCALDDPSAFGENSPFGYLTHHGGKQLMLGSTMWNSLTYVHYVEEQCGVPYRYLKNFTGEYTDENGGRTTKTYQMNVRDLARDIKMTSEKFAPEFYEKGALSTQDFDGVSVSVVTLEKAYPIIEADIKENHSRRICGYVGQGGA